LSNKTMTVKPFKKLAGVSLLVLVMMTAGSALVQAQPSDSSAAAATDVRFQQLEKEVRRLTGQIEEQNYEIRKLRDEVARVTGDLEVRVNDVEARGGSGGGAASSSGNAMSAPQSGSAQYTAQANAPQPDDAIDAPSAPSGRAPNSSFEYTPPNAAPAPSDDSNANAGAPSNAAPGQLGKLNQSPTSGKLSPGDSEAVEYENAYAYVNARDFEKAEAALQAFIAKYPNSSYMPNAKYWYGETFYVRGSYEKAARIFAESYQADPKGSKAAGNLLKLGMSLAGMGKKDDACVAFKQLQKDYASSAVPILKRAETEMKRIGCRS
jgi:tol-pal system protein YbgF